MPDTDLLRRARLYVEAAAEGDPDSKAAKLLAEIDAVLKAPAPAAED